jgi:hypothetical protein
VCHLGAEQWLAAHQSEHAAAVVVQPIDRAPRDIFRHSFYLAVERPAIPTVDIAFVLEEEICRYRMKVPRYEARTNVWQQPATCLPHELLSSPMAPFGRLVWPVDREQFRILREYRLRYRGPFGLRRGGWMNRRMQQEIVD